MFYVRQFNGKWRIQIEGEEWEFEDDTEMKTIFDKLVDFKVRYGQLKPQEKRNPNKIPDDQLTEQEKINKKLR